MSKIFIKILKSKIKSQIIRSQIIKTSTTFFHVIPFVLQCKSEVDRSKFQWCRTWHLTVELTHEFNPILTHERKFKLKKCTNEA